MIHLGLFEKHKTQTNEIKKIRENNLLVNTENTFWKQLRELSNLLILYLLRTSATDNSKFMDFNVEYLGGIILLNVGSFTYIKDTRFVHKTSIFVIYGSAIISKSVVKRPIQAQHHIL